MVENTLSGSLHSAPEIYFGGALLGGAPVEMTGAKEVFRNP
jgi:hypothetical protein